jgi:hypothetical protein
MGVGSSWWALLTGSLGCTVQELTDWVKDFSKLPEILR